MKSERTVMKIGLSRGDATYFKLSIFMTSTSANDLSQRIANGSVKLATIGLGYVGLPLSVEFASSGVDVLGIDVDASKVSAVGLGMRSHTGVAATMFAALSDADINIDLISTSEIVISCLVHRADGPRALQILHDAFGLTARGPG